MRWMEAQAQQYKTVYTTFSMSKAESENTLWLQLGEGLNNKEKNPVYLGVQIDQRLNEAVRFISGGMHEIHTYRSL